MMIDRALMNGEEVTALQQLEEMDYSQGLDLKYFFNQL